MKSRSRFEDLKNYVGGNQRTNEVLRLAGLACEESFQAGQRSMYLLNRLRRLRKRILRF